MLLQSTPERIVSGMLVMDETGLEGEELAYAKFWNIAHSVDALMEGWVLAFWLPYKPQDSIRPLTEPIQGSQIAAIGWEEKRGEPNYFKLYYRDAFEIPFLPREAEVVLATHHLPQAAWNFLKNYLDYTPEILRQRSGWWLAATEPIPMQQPDYRPTGALLLEGTDQPPSRALLLVEVGDQWVVLSQAAVQTYVSSSALVEGNLLRFIPKTEIRDEVIIWNVRFAEYLPYNQIGPVFGNLALGRARDDYPALLVEVACGNP